MVGTYNSKDKHSGGVTYGGYSKQIVVTEDFVLTISDKQPLKALHHCFVQALQPILRFAIGKWVRAIKLV
jgi:D-arabinose 1-dehydrogenase-like Zn-dependent alcohol dehydrogenase